jgi:hypothetical protein
MRFTPSNGRVSSRSSVPPPSVLVGDRAQQLRFGLGHLELVLVLGEGGASRLGLGLRLLARDMASSGS